MFVQQQVNAVGKLWDDQKLYAKKAEDIATDVIRHWKLEKEVDNQSRRCFAMMVDLVIGHVDSEYTPN